MTGDYCPKCKKWNLFGELDEFSIVERQMKKEKIEGTASALLEKDEKKWNELFERYFDERKLIPAGCIVMDECIICKTKLTKK